MTSKSGDDSFTSLPAVRAVMPREEIVQALEGSLRVVLSRANHPRLALEEIRAAWMVPLRQALEQAGGDGFDAWLSTVLTPPGRRGLDPLLPGIKEGFTRMRLALDLASFEERALEVVTLVTRALSFERPRRLSFKLIEKGLEGKLDVPDLLAVVLSTQDELVRRMETIEATMVQLKAQLRSMPGEKPDGMYANFNRLRYELLVVAGAGGGKPGDLTPRMEPVADVTADITVPPGQLTPRPGAPDRPTDLTPRVEGAPPDDV